MLFDHMWLILFLDTLRNDLYLTLKVGEFDKGSKSAQKNIEVKMTVIDKEGDQIRVSSISKQVSSILISISVEYLYY